jgi:iron complex outermembrane receptor protein
MLGEAAVPVNLLRSQPNAMWHATEISYRRGGSLAAVTALAMAWGCGPALAQDDVDPFALSPEQLFDATVVSVSRMPERLGVAPAAVYVLTSEDIMRSGATSIPEALRLVPGVQVARVNTGGWAISVRGFDSALANKLLVLMDGRAVYDPLFSGVYWDVQDTPLEDIERIEVIRGPGASQWGANAVDGVINIITKKASETKGVLVSVTAGNREQPVVTARFGGDAGTNAHWRIYGKYLNRPSSETLTGLDAQDQWAAWRGGFRVDWDPNARGDTFTLQGDIYRSTDGDLRSVPQVTAPYAVVQEENIVASGGNILGRWSRQIGMDSAVSVQAYYDTTSRDQIPLHDLRNTLDVDAQYELPQIGPHKVTLGGAYRYTHDKLTFTPVIDSANPALSENLFSGFLQDKITLDPERWYLTIGSKFEHNDFTGFEVQPTARLQWQADDGQMAWASVSRAVRTPSELENDLHVMTGVIPPSTLLPFPVSVELFPSPQFESEELIAYEAGYRRQWTPTVLTDLTAFFNDYDNLATLSLQAPALGGTPPSYVILPLLTTNKTRANSYGFEAVANWRALNNLNFSAAYSVLQMQLSGPPPSEAIASEAAETQYPEQQFNIRSQWDIDERFAFDTTLYYVSRLPAYFVNAYWRLDMRLGWHVTSNLQFDLVAQDLLQDSHREFNAPTDVNAARIGRSIYGRFVWRQ